MTGLRQRTELGVEVVGWTGDIEGEVTRESVASHLVELAKAKGVHRVIVAMPDRRGTLPVEELMDMRLAGVKIEEATSWMEKIYGRIEVEQLYPSWLIFADGFRFGSFFRIVRRALSFLVAMVGLVIALPLLPFVWLAVRLSSPGRRCTNSSELGGAVRHSTATNSVPCVRTQRPIPAPPGLPTMTRRITRVGTFLRLSVWMRFPSCGAC